MKVIQTELRTGELRLEYAEINPRYQVWANCTRRGWELWIFHKTECREFNTGLRGMEKRTFKEREIMTKWVKSRFGARNQ